MKVLNIEVWVFITVFSFSVIFTVIYMLLKPDNSFLQGFSPFPDIYPSGVPPPDLQQNLTCKNTIQACLVDQDCTKCGPNFQCTTIAEGQNVNYNGIKVRPGLWCLPKPDEKGCGTYTGRSIWSYDVGEGKEKWSCECLYPELFGGETCLDQYACRDISPNAPVDQSNNVLISKTGEIWDPHKIPPDGLSPYAKDVNGKPVFSCSCKQNEGQEGTPQFVSLPNSPYQCNLDPCTPQSSEKLYNPSTQMCNCSQTANLQVLSNTHGTCNPSPCGSGGRWSISENQCVCPDLYRKNCSSPLFYRSGAKMPSCKNPLNAGGSECINPCPAGEQNPCKNNSTCVMAQDFEDGYKCECPPGYEGESDGNGVLKYCSGGCVQKGNPPDRCLCGAFGVGGLWRLIGKNCEEKCIPGGIAYGLGGTDESCFPGQTGKVDQCCSKKGYDPCETTPGGMNVCQ
jgi:hypothetical protein